MSKYNQNSGFRGLDKRSGSTIGGNTKGIIGLEQYYLERIGGRMTPEIIPSGVSAWYDAALGVTLVSSAVSNWADQSGNGLDMTQSTSSNRPAYGLTASYFNNLPEIQCNNDKNMESSYGTGLDCNTSGGFTVYFVCKVDSFVSTYAFMTGRTNSTSWTAGWGIMKYSTSVRFFVNSWTGAYASMTFNDTTNAHIWKMHYDQTTITARTFGPAGSTATYSYSTAVNDPSSSEGLLLNSGNSTSYDGDFNFGEYIFYNRPLTTTEQTKVEEYLSTKYNIIL